MGGVEYGRPRAPVRAAECGESSSTNPIHGFVEDGGRGSRLILEREWEEPINMIVILLKMSGIGLVQTATELASL